ncbi:MAG: PAS domain S-box protein, partial [Anaerolineae bacterium]
MKDKNKSKPQLLEELATTRQQIAQLEAARSELEGVENALRESEEKHRTLFETMTQGVVYQAVNGEIISVNPAAERILGLTLDQMQGRTSMDPRWRAIREDGTAFPGDMHPSMVALRTGEPVRNVVMGVFNPQTEEHVWINVNATPQFRPGHDTPYQVYTTFEDITRRWRAEKALQEERDRAQGYLDIAGFIIVIEPDQTIFLINRKGCEILEYEEQEILGKNWFDTCVPERERERVRSVFDQLMLGAVEPVEYFENAVLTKSGKERIIAWHNTVLRDEAGAIVGALSSGEDITERKQVESERDATLAALRERTHELDERVKELDCLYGLSRLSERPGVSLEEIYQGTVELIPPAWQHPQITGARVVVGDQEFRTENFAEDAPCQQSADIIV